MGLAPALGNIAQQGADWAMGVFGPIAHSGQGDAFDILGPTCVRGVEKNLIVVDPDPPAFAPAGLRSKAGLRAMNRVCPFGSAAVAEEWCGWACVRSHAVDRDAVSAFHSVRGHGRAGVEKRALTRFRRRPGTTRSFATKLRKRDT